MADPVIRLPRDIHHYLFIIDITQSMNVRDMQWQGVTVSRLDYTRQMLSELIGKLPCGSKAGIALFANAEVVPLYSPIETCANYDVLQDTLAHLEWRQAWHGSSRLRFGIQATPMVLAMLPEPAQAIFLTDGDEAPALNAINKIELAGLQGSSGWLLAGIGSPHPSPVPKLNARNEIIGYWSAYAAKFEPSQIVSEESTGQRDDSIATNPAEYYLSALREDYLQELAHDIGAAYVRADSGENLLDAIDRLPPAGHAIAPFRTGWLLALLAAALLMLEYWPERKWRKPSQKIL